MFLNRFVLTHDFHDRIFGTMSGQMRELLLLHIITTIFILYLVVKYIAVDYIINDKEIVYER